MTEFEQKLILLLAEIIESLDVITNELNSIRNSKK